MTRPGWLLLFIGTVLVVVGVLPITLSLLASAVADAGGCLLDEANSHPCVMLGIDWGDLLAVVFVLGWFELVTMWLVPVGLVLAMIGAIQWLLRRGAAHGH